MLNIGPFDSNSFFWLMIYSNYFFARRRKAKLLQTLRAWRRRRIMTFPKRARVKKSAATLPAKESKKKTGEKPVVNNVN